jgi:hypothetical protein
LITGISFFDVDATLREKEKTLLSATGCLPSDADASKNRLFWTLAHKGRAQDAMY